MNSWGKGFLMGELVASAMLFARAAPSSAPQRVADAPVLRRVGTIELSGVEGRMDHCSFDPASGRLFVSATENRSLEVVNVRTRRHEKSIAGINEPQGALFLPRFNRVLVCSRGDGTLRTFDARSFAEGAWVDLGRNADNLRLDGDSGTIYVGANGAEKTGTFDAIELRALLPTSQGGKPFPPRSRADFRLSQPRRADPRASLSLLAQPESFQLDRARHRAYINLPDEHVVAVVDTRTMRVTARWSVPFKRNFPMAFSASRDRVFVASRNPPRLLVYRAGDGKLLSQQPCVGDADEVFYDGVKGRLCLIGGEGKINVFDGRLDTPRLLQTVNTAPRARTGFWIPSLRLLAVAVPHTPKQRAEIALYHIS